MKALSIILVIFVICLIGYFSFPIAVFLLKAVLGLAFLSILGLGIFVGLSKRK